MAQDPLSLFFFGRRQPLRSVRSDGRPRRRSSAPQQPGHRDAHADNSDKSRDRVGDEGSDSEALQTMEWRALLQRLDLSGTRGGGLNKAEATEVLRGLRKSNIRRPDVVLQLGPVVESSLSEAEMLQLYEQMFLASLDMKLDDKASSYLGKLSRQLPGCGRVQRLQGMLLEAKGDYDGAIALYDRLLQENPANISVLQRTAATYKAQGNFNEALSELNKIVELNSADATVWNEIADIHIRLSNYDEAAFCLEEVTLLDPNNHLIQTKLGDLYYSMGEGSLLFRICSIH